MPSFGDVVAQLGDTLEMGEDARGTLNTAADLIGDAVTILSDAFSGSSSVEADEVMRWLTDAERDVRDIGAALTVADRALRDVRSRLAGDAGPVPAGPQVSAGPAGPAGPGSSPAHPPPSRDQGGPERPDPARVDQLRRELPPPVVPASGQRTHGRWLDGEGDATAIVSGRDELSAEAVRFFQDELRSRRIPSVVKDVEIKLAVHMRKNGIRSASLVINNFPCRGRLGCDELIPVVLPAGYTPTVYGPDGFRRVYQGGGTSEWVP